LLEQGFPASSVKTIYIRMNQRLPQASPEQANSILQQLGLAPDYYFLYPANFWRHKNHEMLLTGFLQARSRGLPTEVKLVCTGAPGARLEELKDAVQRLGLASAVLLAGFLDEVAFSALMRSSLGVVFPSLYEGFGMPVLEAMAAGCPVACSNRTSLPEVVGDAALLFDPRKPSDIAEAMCRLWFDQDLRSELMQNGKRRALAFTNSDEMTREYWHLFQRAAGRYSEVGRVQGIYADGWAGPSIALQYGSGHPERSIYFQGSVPEWLPIRKFDVQWITRETGKLQRERVSRGKSFEFEFRIGSAPGAVDLAITPLFQPAELTWGTDLRQLTLQVQRVEIREPHLSCSLYPVQSS
jgi:hypothetical protein